MKSTLLITDIEMKSIFGVNEESNNSPGLKQIIYNLCSSSSQRLPIKRHLRQIQNLSCVSNTFLWAVAENRRVEWKFSYGLVSRKPKQLCDRLKIYTRALLIGYQEVSMLIKKYPPGVEVTENNLTKYLFISEGERIRELLCWTCA